MKKLVRLSGGPFRGAQIKQLATGDSTATFTAKGMTGYYHLGKWVAA